MISRFLALLVSAVSVFAAENDQLPSARRVTWTPGTHTGVVGGIPARTDPAKIINVKESPYFAAGTNAETTGDMVSGEYTVTVADPSSFAVGHNVRVGLPSIQTLVFTGTATQTKVISITIGGMQSGSAYREAASVSVTSGDTAAVIGDKLRVAGVNMAGWDLGGTGATVVFTNRMLGPRDAGSHNTNIGMVSGITTGWTQTQVGTINVTAATVASIAGDVLTLSAAATSSVTGAIVSHDDTPSIQAAVTAAAAQHVVYLPAGTYRFDSLVSVGTSDDNITIRGDDYGSTIIDARLDYPFRFGSSGDYGFSYPSSNNVVSSAMTAGEDEITIGSVTPFDVGGLVAIILSNQTDNAAIEAGATPTFSTVGFSELRRQITRVTAKNAGTNTLTVFPPLYFTADAGLTARVTKIQAQTDFSGIENLTIDGTNAKIQTPIYFEQTYSCWVKGVRVVNSRNYGFYAQNSLNFEARENYITPRLGGGASGAGMLANRVSGGLYEDNIIIGMFPAFEINFSTMGTVVAYNIAENSVGGTINTNHGPHNSFNLYEGNVAPNMQSDGYFGGASDDTFFRNWLNGTNVARTQRSFLAGLNRYTRNYSFIGNIMGEKDMVRANDSFSFGNPWMGTGENNGSNVEPSAGIHSPDWKATGVLTTRTSNTSGVLTLNSGSFYVGQLMYLRWGTGLTSSAGSSFTENYVDAVAGNVITFSDPAGGTLPDEGETVAVFFGPIGYGELDLDVENTTLLKANFGYRTSGIPAAESIGTDTLPASLFRTSKPAYFGDLNWPPFDPFEEDAITGEPDPDHGDIPAGARYLSILGEPPPVLTVATPAFTPSTTTHSAPITVYATSETSGAVMYYTVDGLPPGTEGSIYYDDAVGVYIGYGTTQLQMIGTKDGYEPSAIRSVTYVITAPTGATATVGELNAATLNIAAP